MIGEGKMNTLVWTWVLSWAVMGQHTLLIPYYDTEQGCQAALQHMVDDQHANICPVDATDMTCVIADCTPLSRPETKRKHMREVTE